MIHFIVVGDGSSTNLGDPVLTRSVEFMVKRIADIEGVSHRISLFDIAGRNKNISEQQSISLPTKRIHIQNHVVSNAKALIKWKRNGEKFFLSRLSDLLSINDQNIFVIAGGALISRSLFYGLRLDTIVRYAEKTNGKVIFNAVGVEKAPRYCIARVLARSYLSRRSVIAFSTRDHVDEVKKITKRESFYQWISDPGIWAAECFEKTHQSCFTIGLGMISPQAYNSVAGIEKQAAMIGEKELIEFWGEILRGLDERKLKWKVFTNGGPLDYQLAEKVLQKNGYSCYCNILERPTSPEQLIQHISQFEIVIAHRLHALIIASSFEIPIIGVAWSNKIKTFFKKIRNANVFWPTKEAANKILKVLDNKELIDMKQISITVNECKQESYQFLKASIHIVLQDILV